MDDRIIRKRISTMTTSRDLHSVLNVIKQNMAKEYGVEYYLGMTIAISPHREDLSVIMSLSKFLKNQENIDIFQLQ